MRGVSEGQDSPGCLLLTAGKELPGSVLLLHRKGHCHCRPSQEGPCLAPRGTRAAGPPQCSECPPPHFVSVAQCPPNAPPPSELVTQSASDSFSSLVPQATCHSPPQATRLPPLDLSLAVCGPQGTIKTTSLSLTICTLTS